MLRIKATVAGVEKDISQLEGEAQRWKVWRLMVELISQELELDKS